MDTRALAAKDSDLARFIKRVRTSSNARFVLTTRAPIFEEARRVKLLLELSDQQDDYALDDRPSLVNRLEEGLTEMLGGHMMPDDLESIWDEIAARRTSFSPRVADAAMDAIADHIRDVQSFVEGLDSESELRDHIKTIERVGRRFAIPDDELKRAISVVHERIAEIGEEAETAPSPSRSSMPTPERESFDDRDLANLFAPAGPRSRVTDPPGACEEGGSNRRQRPA